MGRYGTMNYVRLAKLGFAIGLTLFCTGAIGELILHSMWAEPPANVDQMLFWMEALGLIIGLFSPIIFGIFMPLTE